MELAAPTVLWAGAGSLHGMTVYLDHAASTPVLPAVVEAMSPFLTEHYGNPSGAHSVARHARRALDDARDEAASALGCLPGEVVFTGGGTEADNLAIAGRVICTGGVAVCGAAEHHAVLHAVEAASGRVAHVAPDGAPDLEALVGMLGSDVCVLSWALANNETGVVCDLAPLADLLVERSPDAVLHTDAVQAARWLDMAEVAAPAGLVTVAAHKLGGPKGVGLLVVREGVRISPLLHGGGQERQRRSGTQNVAGAVGAARALTLAVKNRAAAVASTAARRDRLEAALTATLDGVTVTAAGCPRLPNISHLLLAGVESEELVILMDRAGVCASAGSSCASGALEPSHVLVAMGITGERAMGVLRLSLAPSTTDDEVDRAVAVVVEAVRHLRGDAASGRTSL